MGKIVIRFVEKTDAEEILDIYEPYIKETAVTAECETPALDEFRSRIQKTAAEYPYLVCLADGKVIGYAYAHRHMERAAYRWNAELSVYIDQAHFRRGIGKTLYRALLEILQLQNVRNVFGGVVTPNKNSEKLHENLGFIRAGVYHNTAYKCGAWHDVVWFEKSIGEYGLEPDEFIPIKKMDENIIREILDRYSEILNHLQK